MMIPSFPCPFSLSAPLWARYTASPCYFHTLTKWLDRTPIPCLRDVKASRPNLPLRGRGRTTRSTIIHPSHFWGERREAGKGVSPSRRLRLASGWVFCCKVLATAGLRIFSTIVTTCSGDRALHTCSSRQFLGLVCYVINSGRRRRKEMLAVGFRWHRWL